MRGEKGSKVRKIRSDKKRDVKPTVSSYVKDSLYYYAYLVGLPVKDAAFLLIKQGLKSEIILLQFQKNMMNDYHMPYRIIVGNRKGRPVKVNYTGPTGKVTIKFTQEVYEELRKLAFAMGLPPTTTAALMLRKTLFTREFMDEHIKQFRRIHDGFRYKEIERFIDSLHEALPKKPQPKEEIKRWSLFK